MGEWRNASAISDQNRQPMAPVCKGFIRSFACFEILVGFIPTVFSNSLMVAVLSGLFYTPFYLFFIWSSNFTFILLTLVKVFFLIILEGIGFVFLLLDLKGQYK